MVGPVRSVHVTVAASGTELSPELDGTARSLGASGVRQTPGCDGPGSAPSRPCHRGQLAPCASEPWCLELQNGMAVKSKCSE